MKSQLAVLSAVLFISAAGPLFGQAGSTLGSSFPPADWNIAGRRIGGVSVAVADNVPQLLGNPANLASLSRLHVFLSSNNARREFEVTRERWEGTPVVLPDVENPADVHWTQGFDPGYSAASLPFHLFERQWAAAASYNGRHWAEFDARYFPAQNEIFGAGLKKDGRVESASAAIGLEVLPSLRAGVSWTRWFGKYEWEQEWSNGWTDDYTGQDWQVGISGVIGPLSLGSALHFPRQVMESTSSSDDPNRVVMTQKSNGAIEIGVGYQPWPRWTLGLGYVYQGSFEVEHRVGESQFNDEYRGASRISAGIEHELSLARVRVPVYVGYVGSWLSEGTGMSSLPFVLTTTPEEDRFRSQLVLGAAIASGAVTFHADSRFTLNSSEQVVSNLPPYS